MSVNFLEPHMPFFGPLNHLYDPAALEARPIFNRESGETVPGSYKSYTRAHAEAGFDRQDLTTEYGWRRLTANYHGLVEMVDNAVGTILLSLEDGGQADNTMVVFTSDHGDMMGSHRTLGKGHVSSGGGGPAPDSPARSDRAAPARRKLQSDRPD
ncbi:MAG: sulfatase-like hydrolase/transferase [Spirochaetaceae bacterium]